MKKLIILILFIGSFKNINSQEGSTQDWSKEDQKTFEAATELFNKHYYESAYEKYISLQANHEKDLFLKFVRGVCAVYINNKHKEAEKLLLEVKKNNSNAENIDYYLALLYHKSYRFDKALEIINGLLTNPNLSKEDRVDLERIAFFSKNGKNEIQYPFETMIESMGATINSEYAEYAPVISPDEESIIFTYRGKGSMGGLVDARNKPDPNGDYNEDIFISKKNMAVWQKPESITELNSVGNDAAIALSPDGQLLFVFKTDGDNGDIYVCKRENGKYSAAEKLKGEVNSPFWEGSLSMSTDQKKLYFASNRPGGFGGKDIYIATKNADGIWGNIKNLGNKINTKYDEDAPFIAPDSRTLIFSSEGHNSIGDFDLFYSNKNKNDSVWDEPKNLGYPINTTDDDLFYVLSPDGKRGYFSSARDGGKGDQDIYVVEPALASRKSYITIIKGKITENALPYETEILVGVIGESKNYGTYKSNPASGNYVVNLPHGQNYELRFRNKNSGDKVFTINTEHVDEFAEKTIDVNFESATSSKTTTASIVFVTNKDTVRMTPEKVATTTPEKTVKKEAPISDVTPSEKTKTEPIASNANTKNQKKAKSVTNEKTETPLSDVTPNETTKPETIVVNSEIKSKNKNKAVIENSENKLTEKPETTSGKSKKKQQNISQENVAKNQNPITDSKPVVSSPITTNDDCGEIKTDHDADFDYKMCNGIWYTKSKTNPFSEYAKDKAKEWTTLSGNTIANERLDKRYPKG